MLRILGCCWWSVVERLRWVGWVTTCMTSGSTSSDKGVSMIESTGENDQGKPVPSVHASAPTLLKTLLRERNWQTYSLFKREYDIAAKRVDKELVGGYPNERTFKRWLSGRTDLPRAEHR